MTSGRDKPQTGAWRCYTADPERRVAVETDIERIPDLLSTQTAFWLDVESPTEADGKRLQELFGFHSLAIEDALSGQGRTKQEQYGDVVFTVFEALNLNPGAYALDTIRLSLFVGDAFLVTTHAEPLRSVEMVRGRLTRRRGALAKGVDHVYYLLVDALVDRYLDIVEDTDALIDQLEDRVFGKDSGENLQADVFDVKRRLSHMRRSLTPKQEVLRALVYYDLPSIRPEVQRRLREVMDHVLRVLDDIEAMREIVNGLMDSYMTRLSNRMNETMKVLSIIATIMLPLSLLTGVFGMNFDVIPGLHWEPAFYVLLGAMGVIAVLLLLFFRRKRML